MKKGWITQVWGAFEFILKNLATPIAFFWMFRAYGARPAIALAIIVTLIQFLAHWLLKLTVSPFFLVASGFTVLFGTLDLLVHAPRFFRLEPFAQNFVMGAVFLVTAFTKNPIVKWFAVSLPERIRPTLSEGIHGYMRKLTIVWSVYFFAKAFLFLYLAFQVDLGRLIILRSLIGGITLVIMFAAEIIYRKYFWSGRLLGRHFQGKSQS